MEVVIHSMGMPFNGETIKKQSLGGSESAAYYMARELARRGHKVSVFTSSREEGSWDGVSYVWHGDPTQEKPLGDRFAFYAENTPHDVLIVQRHPLAFHKDYASKVNIWQLHDLALHRTAAAVNGGLSRVTFTTGVSEWHTKQIADVYGIAHGALKAVPNGVDPDLYRRQPDWHLDGFDEDEESLPLLYQSRPERGLEHLVRPGGIMDRLRDDGVRLYVCGYDNTTPQMADFYGQLKAWADALPNVTWLGALTKSDLAQLQMRCAAMIYPTEFEEVSCITAMEAMHAGLPMITSSCAALPETCRASGTELIPLKDGFADEDAFVAFVKRMTADTLMAMREAQLAAAKRRTWGHAVDVLERAIADAMAETLKPAAVMRHCIEHADIAFLDWYERHTEVPAMQDPICEATMRERREMYAFVEKTEALLAHYERFEGENLDRMNAEGMDIVSEIDGFSRTARAQGILQQVAMAVNKARERATGSSPLRVLEFGCAHGHITLMLAKLFPDVQFVGMDFMGRSVGLAIEHARRLQAHNAVFVKGSLDYVGALERFDIIIAAEVIEHIYDYHGALEILREQLVDGGTMVVTTPYGRWEWLGHDAFRKGREHLHHFEKQDWRDILSGHQHDIVCAPSGGDGTGKAKGSWVVSVTPTAGRPFGRVDYGRKLRELAPRQTVSACLIVKDAEDTLRKCIRSIETYVDEVVVAVDPATSDGTVRLLDRLRDEFPRKGWVTFEGVRALQDGFDAARNRTIERASGDWILWMDADEELPNAHNIWRLLRPSTFNAFGCPQVHYSAQPAQVLTTDYPARLFRNWRGVRFYGLVHEHPEDEPGKSIANACMASDVQFLHNGYVDERTRRARYYRNLPLLMRDIEKHPTRILNKFLLLRDIAQGLMFEVQAGQPMTEERAARARGGVQIFNELLDLDRPIVLRMVLDSLQYYTVCNELLGAGFVASLTWRTAKPPFDSLNAEGAVEARFADCATYTKLLNLIAKETTRNYEARYT